MNKLHYFNHSQPNTAFSASSHKGKSARRRRFLAAVVFCFFAFPAFSQLVISPYSRYGLGDAIFGNSVRNLSMGGITAAVYDSTSINWMNPASYADVRITTFDLSGFVEQRVQKTPNSSGNLTNGGMQNLSYLFSNNDKFGLSFGISPYSSVGYEFVQIDTVVVDGFDQKSNITYKGSGGLSSIYLGAGFRVLKTIRVGANLTYIFGTNNYSWLNLFDDQGYKPAIITEKTSVSGLSPKVGIQYGDTIRIKTNADRLQVLDDSRRQAERELAALQKDEKALSEERVKIVEKNKGKEAKKVALESKRAALISKIEPLMANEKVNEKEIGKLQDKSFRLERHARKLDRKMKTSLKVSDYASQRNKVSQARVNERIQLIDQKITDVGTGVLSPTVKKESNIVFRIGATYDPGLKISGNRTILFNNTEVFDTLSNINNGSATLAPRYIGGISFGQPGKWMLGFDVDYHDWTKFNYFGDVNTLNTSMKFSFGGEVIPSAVDANLAKRMAYRGGAYYHSTMYTLNGSPVNEYGVTFGIGLPVGFMIRSTQTFSRINFGLTLGMRGTSDPDLLRESIIRLNIGMNLNDVWFKKRHID